MSTRLIVKGLPKHLDDTRMREHFSTHGHAPTDTKIVQTKGGVSRCFGFVGFKSEDEANAARAFFDKTFIDTSRISVEVAIPVGDPSLPRPWSRYSKGSSQYASSHPSPITKTVEKPVKKDTEKKKDALLDEFITAMQPRQKSKLWADDAAGESEMVRFEDAGGSDSEYEDAPNEQQETVVDDMAWLREKAVEKNVLEVEEETSSRLFVRNLSFLATEAEVASLFSPFGPLSEVHIPIDRLTKKSRGTAFVLFEEPAAAAKAQEALDGRPFQGRLLHILDARPRPQHLNPDEGGAGSFKRKKETEQKASAGQSFNWNALFVKSDTVAGALAEKLGVQKSSILDPAASNVAVRLAVGEAHIVSELKSFLASEGVDITTFEQATQRSKTVILVKNLPSDSDTNELIPLFARFGTVGRLVMPPSKVMALVEMPEPTEARAAFRSLAYSRFKGTPLFLEWAPDAVFDPAHVAPSSKRRVEVIETVPANDDDEDEEATSHKGHTLHVKNLSFATTEETLRAALGGDAIRSVMIAKKFDPKRGGRRVSRGFGFVEFANESESLAAYKKHQGMTLDGNKIELQFSRSTTAAAEPKSKRRKAVAQNKPSRKIMVRNIAFEATKKDIRELFGAFGEVKQVRLPKKFDGSHRGFAFAEFPSLKEAKHAMSSLGDTHLYGRRLVLEYAEEGMDEVVVE